MAAGPSGRIAAIQGLRKGPDLGVISQGYFRESNWPCCGIVRASAQERAAGPEGQARCSIRSLHKRHVQRETPSETRITRYSWNCKLTVSSERRDAEPLSLDRRDFRIVAGGVGRLTLS